MDIKSVNLRQTDSGKDGQTSRRMNRLTIVSKRIATSKKTKVLQSLFFSPFGFLFKNFFCQEMQFMMASNKNDD